MRIVDLWADYEFDLEKEHRKSIPCIRRRWLNHLKPFFGPMRAAQLKPADIDRYLKARLASGCAIATCNREVAALKRMFSIAVEKGRLQSAPKYRLPAERNARKGFISEVQFQELVKHTPQLWLRTICEVAYTCGLRRAEILDLRVEQVDLAGRTLRLEAGETKNDEARIAIMSETLYALVRECVAGKKPSDPVFTDDSGAAVADATLRRQWEIACSKAGLAIRVHRACYRRATKAAAGKKAPVAAEFAIIDNYCVACGERVYPHGSCYAGPLLHDCRRSFVRNCVRRGVSEKVAMALSGHKTRSVFDRYNISSASDLIEAMRKVEIGAKAELEKARIENNLRTAVVTASEASSGSKVAKSESVN